VLGAVPPNPPDSFFKTHFLLKRKKCFPLVAQIGIAGGLPYLATNNINGPNKVCV